MTKDNQHLAIGTILGLAFIAFALWAFPKIEPNAPDVLMRVLLMNTTVGIQKIIILTIGMKLFDRALDGDWAKVCAENPYAAAAVYCTAIWSIFSGMVALPVLP